MWEKQKAGHKSPTCRDSVEALCGPLKAKHKLAFDAESWWRRYTKLEHEYKKTGGVITKDGTGVQDAVVNALLRDLTKAADLSAAVRRPCVFRGS